MLDRIPKEVGILISVTAPAQELATNIASFVSHRSAHLPIPEYQGLVSSIAYPFSPEIERGAIYRFMLNHVVAPDNGYAGNSGPATPPSEPEPQFSNVTMVRGGTA